MKDFFCLLFYNSKRENTKIWPLRIELGTLNPSVKLAMNEKKFGRDHFGDHLEKNTLINEFRPRHSYNIYK